MSIISNSFNNFKVEFQTAWKSQKLQSKETSIFEKAMVSLGMGPSKEVISQAYHRYGSVDQVQWNSLWNEEGLTKISVLASVAEAIRELVKRVFPSKKEGLSFEQKERDYFNTQRKITVVVDEVSYEVPETFVTDMDRGMQIGDKYIPQGTSLDEVIRKMLKYGLTKTQIDKVTHLLTQRISASSYEQLCLGTLSIPIAKDYNTSIKLDNGKLTLIATNEYELLRGDNSIGNATTNDTIVIDRRGNVSDPVTEIKKPDESVGMDEVIKRMEQIGDQETITEDDEEFLDEYLDAVNFVQEALKAFPDKQAAFIRECSKLINKLRSIGRQDLINKWWPMRSQ